MKMSGYRNTGYKKLSLHRSARACKKRPGQNCLKVKPSLLLSTRSSCHWARGAARDVRLRIRLKAKRIRIRSKSKENGKVLDNEYNLE